MEIMKLKIPFRKERKTVSVLRLSGMISNGARGQINDQTFAPVIERAFEKGNPSAVALVINSPGGSPVQSSLIAARIRRLSEEKNIPVLAFVEDVAASGGYWIAIAADEIFVDANSIVGSIGVISAGFGLHDLIARYGVERRVYTAGTSKSTLDPFQPEKTEDVERLKSMLEEVHETFKIHVSNRRGAKLSQNEDLFTGAFWTGQKAIELGLVDQLGHSDAVLKARFGDKVRVKTYGPKKSWASRFGARVLGDAALLAEEKIAFARFGL